MSVLKQCCIGDRCVLLKPPGRGRIEKDTRRAMSVLSVALNALISRVSSLVRGFLNFMEPAVANRKPLTKPRLAAFVRQEGQCHYCHVPMWLTDPSQFMARFRLSQPQARQFECTGEHLEALQDGGSNCEQNIVAACFACNQRRHWIKPAPSSTEYAKIVLKQMKHGCWHKKKALLKIMLGAAG